MTSEPLMQKQDGGHSWLTVSLSLMVGAAFFGLWFWLLPGWLGFSVKTAGSGLLR